MRLEELVDKANAELSKEEKDNEERILYSIYERFKSNIKNEVEENPVNVLDKVEYFCRCTNRSKVFNNVARRLKEEGYYIVGNNVYISYDLFKKYRKCKLLSFAFFFILILLLMCMNRRIIINFVNILF